jgi:hypothetical protein
MRKRRLVFLCLLSLNGSLLAQRTTATKATYIPSTVIDGRFYIKIPVANGDTLLAFCDTGGGYNAIYPAVIAKLHLEDKVLETDVHGTKVKYIPASELVTGGLIPFPHINPSYKRAIQVPFFQIAGDDMETKIITSYIPHDVFLGQFFFIGHSWTFNYPKRKLYINTPLSSKTTFKNMQRLGFKKDTAGNKLFGHPSMQVEIDGQVIDVLFDTGASILLNEITQAKLKIRSKSMAGSFIAKSIFDKWRLQHPDWRYIEKGERTGADLIQVPSVKVGNTTAGPVWFAKRPDEAWSKGMIQSMDKVVKGAVGGSLFQYFTVTIDYNSELASFEKAK